MSLKSGSVPKTGGACVFEKKAKNPFGQKYANVQGIVDSGPTVAKQAPTFTDNQLAKMRNEVFKRVSCAKLVSTLEAREGTESIFALAGNSAPFSACGATSIYSQQTLNTVVSIVSEDAQPIKPQDDVLVLDVRPREEYVRCHLQHAVSYEKRKLQQDQITPELWTFKQQSTARDEDGKEKGKKKLVLYDRDDNSTAEIATLLVQKGWGNVYALTGGMDEIASTYAEKLEGAFETNASVQNPLKSIGGKAKQHKTRAVRAQ